MIDFRQILPADCVRTEVRARSMKGALEEASECLALRHSAINARRLLEGLLSRERLGSTGIGDGVAIPHCRFDCCRRPVACLLRTRTPIEFDSPDGVGVDLLFVLAVPPGEQSAHLEILGALARVFDDSDNLAALRAATDDLSLFDALHRQITLAQQTRDGT